MNLLEAFITCLLPPILLALATFWRIRGKVSRSFSTTATIHSFIIGLGLMVVLLPAFSGRDQASLVLGLIAVIAILLFGWKARATPIASGLLLAEEGTLKKGDLVRFNDTEGFVESLDAFSIKLRTHGNHLVRIPNEKVIAEPLTNLTRYPIRRLDVKILVSNQSDMTQVFSILDQVANNNPLCLEEPAPLILFEQFHEHSAEFTLGLWFEKHNYVELKNTVMQELKQQFDVAGILTAESRTALALDTANGPLSVTMVAEVHPEEGDSTEDDYLIVEEEEEEEDEPVEVPKKEHSRKNKNKS